MRTFVLFVLTLMGAAALADDASAIGRRGRKARATVVYVDPCVYLPGHPAYHPGPPGPGAPKLLPPPPDKTGPNIVVPGPMPLKPGQ
jgi:hypothetical protein